MVEVIVVVNGKSFFTTKETLLCSKYFCGIFELNSDEKYIVINDKSDKLFDHVLSYMRDYNYPFPGKYWSELDFYLVDKNKYNCKKFDCFKKLHTKHDVQSDYCEYHTCAYKNCVNNIVTASNYCSLHTCNYFSCKNAVFHRGKTIYNYCKTHKCETLGCCDTVRLSYVNDSFLKCCDIHKCEIPNCYNAVVKNEINNITLLCCRIHKCKIPGCTNIVFTSGINGCISKCCSKHTCRESVCMNIVNISKSGKLRSKYCVNH